MKLPLKITRHFNHPMNHPLLTDADGVVVAEVKSDDDAEALVNMTTELTEANAKLADKTKMLEQRIVEVCDLAMKNLRLEQAVAEYERQIFFLRESLDEIARFGKKHTGFGYSCAKIAEKALESLDFDSKQQKETGEGK